MNISTYSKSPYPTGCDVKGLNRQPSIREHLEDQKSSLSAQLSRVNEAIAALDAAPETARVLELISKV